MKRAAVSAEGFSRFYFNDKVRFYYQARGSLGEVRNYLVFVRDVNYCTTEKANELLYLADYVNRLIDGLINSIHKQQKKSDNEED
jgi:four helix bundle protein